MTGAGGAGVRPRGRPVSPLHRLLRGTEDADRKRPIRPPLRGFHLRGLRPRQLDIRLDRPVWGPYHHREQDGGPSPCLVEAGTKTEEAVPPLLATSEGMRAAAHYAKRVLKGSVVWRALRDTGRHARAQVAASLALLVTSTRTRGVSSPRSARTARGSGSRPMMPVSGSALGTRIARTTPGPRSSPPRPTLRRVPLAMSTTSGRSPWGRAACGSSPAHMTRVFPPVASAA